MTQKTMSAIAQKPQQAVAPSPPLSTTASSRSSLFFPIFIGLAILVYLFTTGILPLVGRDEPRYVEIGREMLNSGDWITPRLGGHTWFEKPVLLYWMEAASFSVFGVSEWAARLGSALCGLGCAASIWWMIKRTDRRIAQWASVALLSSGGMLSFSHGATFDIVLTFCVTLALSAWWMAQLNPERATKHLSLFWAAVGLAFLAKGLVAFVLPLGVIGLYALLSKEKVRLGLWWGLPLALAVSSVWYLPVIATNGSQFVNEFFVQHHFQRFTSDKFKHHEPIWFFLKILPLLMLPWAPFLVVALWRMRGLQRNSSLSVEDSARRRLALFALAWTAVPVAFFSLSGSKLPGYILPSLPGAAVLVGLELSRWAQGARRTRAMSGLALATVLAAALLTTTGPGVSQAERKSARHLFQVAHQRGLGHLRVATFETTVRAAEFYAASTLLYENNGEPVCIRSVAQLAELTRSEPMLILVNNDDRASLNRSALRIDTIADNGKMTLVLVQARQQPHPSTGPGSA